MDPLIDGLNTVLRYQRERLPVSAIHPELRFTRLGAILREHATEQSDVGELAYQALTSDHSQPLELMPLHLLRDKMQEEPDHPLNHRRLNWTTVPDRVALDQTLRSAVNKWNADNPNADDQIGMFHLNSNRMYPGKRMDGITQVLDEVHKAHSPLSANDVSDSIKRMLSQDNLRWFGEGAGNEEVGPDRQEYHADRLHNNVARSTAIGHPSETYR